MGGYGFKRDLDGVDNTTGIFPLLGSSNGDFFPSFVLEMIRVYEEDQMLNLDEKEGVLPSNKITAGFVELPVTIEAKILFSSRFFRSFQYFINFEILFGVINDRELMAMIEDKIIVIGSSAAGLNDLHATNLEQAVPGPIIMLSAIHQNIK